MLATSGVGDADSLRKWLDAKRIKAVIPPTASRTVPYSLDRRAYKRRIVVERLFGRLKNWPYCNPV